MADFLSSIEGLDLPAEVKERLRLLQPPSVPNVETIVGRLSLARTFTDRLYGVATAGLDGVLPFPSFAAAADVEPVLGFPGRFAVSPRTRAQHLSRWVRDPQERARLAADCLTAMDPNDPVEGLDRLQLLFLGDQAEARAALRRAFDAADAAHDIPRCSALVQLVVSTIQLFGDDQSAALCAELRARSQSRNLFFAEFTQTHRYFGRPLDVAIGEFVAGRDDRWIFHVWAPGGMGKTTMLRRLISHDWVVGAGHVPCAWLDMDYLDVATILQLPALLGLVMAAQWNEQLAQPVFGAFLTTTLQPLGSLLFRTRSDGSGGGVSNEVVEQRARTQYRAGLSNPMRCGILAGAVPPRTLSERQALMAQTGILLSYWNDKLPEALALMPPDRPAVLVIDTLEDASLHHGQQLLDMLNLVRALRDKARHIAATMGRPPVNLRLVLSGRYQLGKEHVAAFAKEFANEYREAPLEGFEATEARAFLAGIVSTERTHAERQDLIAAMVDQSHGIPFNLSLFAEWANDDPALDAATVRQSDDVSAVMLIERTVKRIGYQPLRWIVRYGVVPRTLSLGFLRDVMRQPLLDALSGRAARSGIDRPTSVVEQDVWALEADFVFDAEALWIDHVLPYASDRSWVTAGDRPGEVVLRSDIVQPMRRLLGQQAVFRQLHERARDWFKARMADPADGLNATIEYLYHCLQLRLIDGGAQEDMLPLLREFLGAPALAADPGLRVTACAALQDAVFSDLTPSERAFVGYMLAEALAAQHDYAFRTQEAAQALRGAIEAAGAVGVAALPPFAAVWSQSLAGVSVSQLLVARDQLPPGDRLRVALLLSELSEPRSPVALDVLTTAVAEAAAMSSPPVPVGILASRLATRLRVDSPEAAVRYLETAAHDFDTRRDLKRATDAVQLASAIELELGRLTRAQQLIARLGNDQPAVARRRAELELAAGNPGTALGLLDRKEADASVERWLLRAEALSRQLQLREAREAWDQASRAASSDANAATMSRVAIGQARLYLWSLRTTPKATPALVASLLTRAQTAQSDVSQRALAGPVPDVEVWQIAGNPASDQWSRRARSDYQLDSPLARVRLTLALSQAVPDLHPRRWHDLIENATRLPTSARILALAEPVLRGQPADIEPDVRRAIADVFEHEPEGPIEAAWYALRRGELLAWLGFVDEAVELLAGVPVLSMDYSGPGWVAAVYRERRRVEQRLREWTPAGRPGPLPDPDPPELWRRFWGHTPFRAAAATLENAQRALDAGDRHLMGECLDIAQPGLQEVELETEFHVLATRLRALSGATRSTAREPRVSDVRGALAITPHPGEMTAGTESAGPSAFGEPGRLGGPSFGVVELREQSGRLAVVHESAPAVILSAENETLEILLRSRGIPRRLIGRRMEELAADLADVLQQGDVHVGERRLGLKIPHATLASAPWELALSSAAVMRSALFRLPSDWQEARVADETRASELTLGVQEAGRSTPVLFQPLSSQDHESPAARAYALLGSTFDRRMDESGRTAGTAWAVHVASSFIELPNVNEPALDGVSWTASTLAHTISGFAGPFRPAVVLDTPMPATSSDLLHQLLLRNAFAQALIDTGVVGCVLATGLYPQDAMLKLHPAIAEALRPEAPRIDLLDAVIARTRDLNLLGHDALFTGSPYQPMATGRPMYV